MPSEIVDAALESSGGLTSRERAAVRALVGGGEPVILARLGAADARAVVLDRAAAAWRMEGRAVVGVSPDTSAAHEFEDATGIAGATVRGLLADVAVGAVAFDADRVLVVDGAHRLGTPSLATVLEAARGSKVVLLTDGRLPEHDLAGIVREYAKAGLVIDLPYGRDGRELGAAATARIVRGVARAPRGPALAIDPGRDDRHGLDDASVVIGAGATALRERLLADWWASDRGAAFMVAGRRAEIASLNRSARAVRVAAGDLPAGGVVVRGREFQVGDRIVAEAADRRAGVHAGALGTVVRTDAAGLTLATSDGDVAISMRYLERGHVDHAYALSAYRARFVADAALLHLGRPAPALASAARLRGDEPPLLRAGSGRSPPTWGRSPPTRAGRACAGVGPAGVADRHARRSAGAPQPARSLV